MSSITRKSKIVYRVTTEFNESSGIYALYNYEANVDIDRSVDGGQTWNWVDGFALKGDFLLWLRIRTWSQSQWELFRLRRQRNIIGVKKVRKYRG